MQGITAFIASTVPCTRRDANYAVPALFVSVGLPVLDELVPSLELLLNAPGARANHTVPVVLFEGGGAGRQVLLYVSPMRRRDLGVLLHEVIGDCLFVVV